MRQDQAEHVLHDTVRGVGRYVADHHALLSRGLEIDVVVPGRNQADQAQMRQRSQQRRIERHLVGDHHLGIRDVRCAPPWRCRIEDPPSRKQRREAGQIEVARGQGREIGKNTVHGRSQKLEESATLARVQRPGHCPRLARGH